jgi:hypothetical protein
MYLGDFPTSAPVSFHWNTCDQTGASITRSTDGTLKLYKDGSPTERSSLSGVTQTEDFDAQTGVHYVKIDLSDNTDAGFYAAGSEYSVVMTGMTIDTKVVSAVLAQFSIERAGGALALLKSGTSGLSALKTLLDAVDDYLDTEVAAIKTKTDLLPASPAAVGSAMTLTSGERTAIADATRARPLTEGYAADGVAPTLEQAVFMIMQGILEFGIAGTVLTTRKLDKSTTAYTHTLDDATAPTRRTRAT